MLNKARAVIVTAATTLTAAGLLLSGAGAASAGTPPPGGGGSLVYVQTFDWDWTCRSFGNWLILNGRVSDYQCWNNGHDDYDLMVRY
ncbi:hypothetical protein ABZ721_31570 [Streptomyces sp. NPDC006733]|uniref:hypothetical protein n=1 Tax=Streptomyces sp. NPDC006733 TaxID=3155460 RepID=UPI0033FC8CBF